MAEIVKITKDGVVQYPITKPEAVIDEDGMTIKEKLTELSEKIDNFNPTPMISVTYAELVALRDDGELIAGMQYRITDYVTTTAQENTQSAGHQFDVIVTADNANTLNEVARACLHDGDTYFSEAGAKLEAWQIWYCLDNDTERFAWASEEILDSTGCSIKSDLVDGDAFKNPMPFSYLMWNDPTDGEIYESEKLANDLIYEYGYETEPNGNNSLYLVKSDASIYEDEGVDYQDKFYYRGREVADGVEYDCWQKAEYGDYIASNMQGPIFALTERIVEGNIVHSVSGKGVIYRMIDEHNNDLPYDFKNIMFIRYELDAPEEYAAESKDDVWIVQRSKNLREQFSRGQRAYIYAGVSADDRYWEDDWGVLFSSPTGETKAFYTFSTNSDEDASLLDTCHDNKMMFSKDLPNNVFFGNYCNSNSFGNDCNSNSFGNSYNYNSFGNSCNSNSFGNDCNYNSFGNDCNSNSFGNDCYYNSFGNYCNSNSFGNSCYSNSFGNDSQSNELKAYYRNITLGEGVQYVTLQNDDAGGVRNQVQYYRVANGTQGESAAPLVIDVQRGLDYETTIAKNSDGEVKVFCMADLIS